MNKANTDTDHHPHLTVFLGTTWAIKNLVLTDTLKHLQGHFRLSVWVPHTLFADTVQLAEEMQLQDVHWHETPPARLGKIHQFACRIQKGVMYSRHNVATEEIASQSIRGRRSRSSQIANNLLRFILHTPLAGSLFNIATRWRQKSVKTAFFKDAFREDKPDLILLTNAVDREDDPVYFAAHSLNIPQLNMVHSWDNLTSKGIIHLGLAKVLVWNRVMKDEVLKMYPSYVPAQVAEVGISRFDVYHLDLPKAFCRESFLNRLGLDPAGRMMIYANTSTVSFPSQLQVLDHIITAMKDGSLPADLQLLIRLHPHDIPADYKRFHNEDRVAVWPLEDAPENKRQSSLVPPVDDLWVLAASLRHSNLCINAASTMALDAAACDIPVISVAYDGNTHPSYFDSIKSAYDYNHQKPFLELDAVDLVESRQELVASIAANLDNAGIRTEQRKSVRHLFLGGEQSAVDRFSEAILTVLPPSTMGRS